MRLAREIQSSPDVPVWADHTLRAVGIETVAEVSLFINDRMMKVSLDLSQEWRANLLRNVQFVLDGYSVFLLTYIVGVYIINNYQYR